MLVGRLGHHLNAHVYPLEHRHNIGRPAAKPSSSPRWGLSIDIDKPMLELGADRADAHCAVHSAVGEGSVELLLAARLRRTGWPLASVGFSRR